MDIVLSFDSIVAREVDQQMSSAVVARGNTAKPSRSPLHHRLCQQFVLLIELEYIELCAGCTSQARPSEQEEHVDQDEWLIRALHQF